MTRVAARLAPALLASAAIATLAACGLKGDLYLPEEEDDPSPAQQTPDEDGVGEEIEEEPQDSSSRTPSR
jgi:predicted small lipoprotein YifL